MSDNSTDDRQVRLPSPPSILAGLSGRQLLALAVGTHGLADVCLTLAFWSHETNPVVLDLGPVLWVGLKVALVASFASAWWVGRQHRHSRPIVGVAATFGTLVVITNVLHLVLGWG